MWCAKCQAEVAAEVAADNRRIRCASCGSEIDAAPGLRTSEKTREARELLQRWSSSRLLEPAAAATDSAEPTASVPTADAPPQIAAADPAAKLSALAPAKGARRFDKPHSAAAAPHETPAPQHVNIARPPVRERRAATSEPAAAATDSAPLPPRTHAAHAAVPPPHTVDVQSAIIHDEPRATNWLAACGQLLAYAGVLGLTVGSTLVVWGHFGGAEQQHYTPNGWLVATAGQMLLFLGVVTMVSGGLEQTTEEVRRRVERLNDRLARIEHTLRHQPPRETARLAEPHEHAPTAANEHRAAA